MIKKKILLLIIIIFISFLVGAIIFMINNDWHFRIFKSTKIKEIDGKQYLGIESYSNRSRKTVIYYEFYNTFAYKKTKEYIEEFYDYNDYGQPLYREYHKNPQTNSVIYYYDNSGNVMETKTYDEKGAIVDVQKSSNK